MSIYRIVFPLLLVCIFSENSFSQNTAAKPFLKFGNVPPIGTNVIITDYDMVLSNPQFICTGGEVISFILSFQPRAKDFVGPFKTKGDRLTDEEIAVFKRLRYERVERVQVFFEEIKIKKPDGLIRTAAPLTFTIIPK